MDMIVSLNTDRSETFRKEFPFVVRSLGIVKYLSQQQLDELKASIKAAEVELAEQDDF